MSKRGLLVLAVVAGLLLAAAIAFKRALEIDQYREELSRFVAARTGRSFSIDGNIGFRFVPVPTLWFERVRLGNPGWAQTENLISIERLAAVLAPGALLQARLQVKRLHLQGVELELETRGDGRGNWLPETAPVTAPVTAGWVPDYDLEAVQVSRMTMRLRAHDDTARQLDVQTLTLSPRDAEPILDIELGARLDGSALSARGSMSRFRDLIDDAPSMLSLDGRLGELEFTFTGRTQQPSAALVDNLEFEVTAPGFAALGAPFALALPGAKPVELAGSLVREEDRYRIEPLVVRVGTSELHSSLVVEQADARWRIDGRIAANRLDSADFLMPATRRPDDGRVFPDTELPFAWLSRADAALALSADTLSTPVAVFEEFSSRIEIVDGNATIGPATARLAGGGLRLRLDIRDASVNPGITTEVSLSGARLDQLPKIAARKTASGGTLDLAVNIAGHGRSVRDIMGYANGTIAVDIAAAKFHNKAVNLAEADLLWSFVTRLNPFATRESSSEVECVAVRFPLRDGIAENPAGIGILTRKLGILGGGKLNFATERIDLGARPKPREGLGLSVSGLVDFLRLGGTLKNPRALADTAGVATAGAKVGAAFATAGLSVLAEGLFDRVSADARVCDIVRDSLAAPAAGPARGSVVEKTAETAKSAVRGAGEAIKNVFEGLFGN